MTKQEKLTLDAAHKAAEEALDTKRLDRDKLKRICAEEHKKVVRK